MDHIRRWFPLLVASLLLGVVNGQEMWAGTRTGMSPDEVVRLVPNAYRATGGPDFRAFDNWPGMSLQARVDRVEILGASARAMFGFINNGLERVVLSFSTDDMSITAFENQCRTLRAALNGRYGPEGSVREEDTGSMFAEGAMKEYLWFSGQTQVRLSCANRRVTSSPNWLLLLSIIYHHGGPSGL